MIAAFADGADYVELDLHVSKDNVLVVSHDRDLSRVVRIIDLLYLKLFLLFVTTIKQANGDQLSL